MGAFIIGCIVGGCFGFFVAALVNISKKGGED